MSVSSFLAYLPVGSGKTILGANACKSFKTAGYRCIWITRLCARAFKVSKAGAVVCIGGQVLSFNGLSAMVKTAG
jgi:hypothetical protein